MDDIKYENDHFKFAYRVSAIIYNLDKTDILLFTGKDMTYYMLPGGKVKELENSIDAIKREIEEEIGFKSLSFTLSGISEEIIKHNNENIHQITLTYSTVYRSSQHKTEFKSVESDWISFKWVKIKELHKYKIHPSNIINMLNKSNPIEIVHIIENK